MKNPPIQRKSRGFTLVELLVAAAIGAALITAAVVGFGVISNISAESGSVNLELPSGAVSDLYGAGSGFITVGANPNYFQGIQARLLKDRLVKDAASGTAIFCLGRDFRGSPAIRPGSLAVQQGTDFRAISSPDAFYEVDFVPTSEPSGGTLATVRRFSGTNRVVPTDYYHAYYPREDNGANGFRPLAAHFPRAAAGGGAFAAENYPFTFVWWPDPLVSRLEGAAVPSGSGVPSSYANMAGRTGLFFVLPTFPPL
jgi:prepilin-type N-terminal cleavage/methylation domain-containing protein